MPPPAAVAVLMEELVEEFLLRIPPDDPASLVRAALVCKPWCRIVSGPGFRRRFRELHRTPPMLGFCYVTYDDVKIEVIARFVPTTSFTPRRGISHWQPIDSRHGRVLLHSENWDDGRFVIWDPITNKKQKVPVLPRLQLGDTCSWSASVLCAAVGKCDHLDCQRGASSVVAVGNNSAEIFVDVYSSEVGAWSQVSVPKTGEHLLVESGAPGALVGNALYFSCFFNTKILRYDLGTRKISFIDGLPRCTDFESCSTVLMAAEDGRLAVAYVLNFKLHIWLSEVSPNRDARWSLSKVIDLATLPPFGTLSRSPRAVGSADGVGLIFLRTVVGLFTIDLKSGHVRKMSADNGISHCVIPFMSFYTPALGMASTAKVTQFRRVEYMNYLKLLVQGLLNRDGNVSSGGAHGWLK